MSIPGEDQANSLPAISFVGWYNGHPDYREPVGIVGRRGWVEGLRVERNQLVVDAYRYTTYQGWRILDGHEPARGPARGDRGVRSPLSRRCWRSFAAGVDMARFM
jgi:hypothetical protein